MNLFLYLGFRFRGWGFVLRFQIHGFVFDVQCLKFWVPGLEVMVVSP